MPRLTRYLILAVFLANLFLTLSPTSADEANYIAAPANLSLDDIVAGLEKSENTWGALKSWMVRYEHAREGINFALPIVFDPCEMVNARKGGWLYASWLSESADNDSEQVWVTWRSDKYTQRTYEDVVIENKEALLKSGGNSFLYQMWWYLAELGVYPVSDALPYEPNAKGQVRSFQLSSYLKAHRKSYHVRANLEVVEGVLCHVLEWTDRDIIWIDPATGYSLRRRTAYAPEDNTLAYEFRAYRVRERAPGIWLPERQVAVTFTGKVGEKGSLVEKVVLSTLKEARFNDLPDDFFQVPLKDAKHVFDLTNPKKSLNNPKDGK